MGGGEDVSGGEGVRQVCEGEEQHGKKRTGKRKSINNEYFFFSLSF